MHSFCGCNNSSQSSCSVHTVTKQQTLTTGASTSCCVCVCVRGIVCCAAAAACEEVLSMAPVRCGVGLPLCALSDSTVWPGPDPPVCACMYVYRSICEFPVSLHTYVYTWLTACLSTWYLLLLGYSLSLFSRHGACSSVGVGPGWVWRRFSGSVQKIDGNWRWTHVDEQYMGDVD